MTGDDYGVRGEGGGGSSDVSPRRRRKGTPRRCVPTVDLPLHARAPTAREGISRACRVEAKLAKRRRKRERERELEVCQPVARGSASCSVLRVSSSLSDSPCADSEGNSPLLCRPLYQSHANRTRQHFQKNGSLILGFTRDGRPLHVQSSYPSRPVLKIIQGSRVCLRWQNRSCRETRRQDLSPEARNLVILCCVKACNQMLGKL